MSGAAANIYGSNIVVPANFKSIFGVGTTVPELTEDIIIELITVRLANEGNLAGTFINGRLTVPGALVVDGVAPNLLDRILLAEQTDPVENGVYRVLSNTGPSVLIRTVDFKPNIHSSKVFVEEGLNLNCTLWHNHKEPLLVVNVDPIKFLRVDGSGDGTVIGIPPTVPGNIAIWDDVNATIISDGGININDLLDALNRIITVTLTGTAWSLVLDEDFGSFFISVKNEVVDGPSANFAITKNRTTGLPSVVTLASVPGVGTGEVLELRWLSGGDIELHKTGINYDGDYRVTIYGPGIIPSLLQNSVIHTLTTVDTRVFDPILTIISSLSWDASTFSGYSGGEITFRAEITGKTLNIQLREVGGAILTAIPAIVATGSYTYSLTSLPAGDSKVVLEVQAIGAGADVILNGVSLKFNIV